MNSVSVPESVGHNGASSFALKADEASSLFIRDVCKTFPAADGGLVRALDHISLSIAPGELVGLIGQSGCGKSTLLRLIAGLDQPTSGELRVGTELIRRPSAERGMMFQNHNLFPWLTVRRNIQFGLSARGLLRRRRQEVEELMRVVGLEAFANNYPHQLSGGMAQRVALARALINHPKVLLLDEPLGALDQLTRMQMQDEIQRLWQARRMTMVLVTHYVDEAIYMSDRVIVMTPRPGRIERVIDVKLARPRQRNSTEFFELRSEILELLHFAEKKAEESKGTTTFGPLSSTGPDPGKVVAVRRVSPSDPVLDAEVIIMGGGPAGSVLGTYLAQAGVDHIILERAVHPRRHVGESLVCSTTRVFQEIDFLKVMEHEGFVRKHGARWFHWVDRNPRTIRFREMPELGTIQDYTYHVDRSRFDQLLLQHAAERGSRVLQGAHVQRVEFGPNGAALGVRIREGSGERVLRSRVVVDASGRNTVLGAQLKLKCKEPVLNQFAVYNWFEGFDRGEPEAADFIHCHVLPGPRSWAWQIPITPSVTSIGVVTGQEEFVKAGEDVAEFFAGKIAGNGVLGQRMQGARALHPYQREGNYSYVMERFAGDGWLLVGDAARFLDPVFSSGVGVALESARRAAAAICDALAQGDVSRSSFDPYEKAMQAACAIWREFILLYYRLPPLFLELLAQPASRLQLVQLLQGDVYDRRQVPILERMRREIETIEQHSDHPWKPHLDLSLPLPEGAETLAV
jgi:ABC-type nitrate/sulfonate/bicarbonate transport system ATPase subunit/flavin-dependent dehydrogenase